MLLRGWWLYIQSGLSGIEIILRPARIDQG